MILPYTTDAPLYHPPITTGTLIGLNVATFVMVMTSSVSASDLALSHGDGLHPIQWITSNFIHGDVMHLLGNMMSLWVFGLVVEGKIGWWRMLLLYLGIGVGQCALEQTITLGMSSGESFGASSIIYGLMAIAIIWAPSNEVSCVTLIWYYPITFEIPVFVMVCLLLTMDIFLATLSGLAIATQTLHLMGAAIGFGVGLVMLKRESVDCEYYDIFSVFRGLHRMTDEQRREIEEQSPGNQRRRLEQQESLAQTTQRNLRDLIEQGRADTAATLLEKMLPRLGDWHPAEPDLLALISALHKQQQWSESIPVMVEYLRHDFNRNTAVRLKLAQIVLVDQQRPAQTLAVLAKLDATALDDKQRRVFAKIQAQAERALQANPYDTADYDW